MYCVLRDVMGYSHVIETRDINTFMKWFEEYIPEIIQNGFGTVYPWTIEFRPSDPNEQISLNGWNNVIQVLNPVSLGKALRELADNMDKPKEAPAEETPDPDSTELDEDDGTS